MLPRIRLLVLVLALSVALAGCGDGRVVSERRLDELWSSFKVQYMNADGAVVDPLRNGTVTSEAQSYALLRAVWMNDREAFDRTWAWTREHLARADGLHSWLWDPAVGRVIDENSATDGDEDIAFALLLAARAFQRPDYADRAREIVQAIRRSAGVRTTDGWMPSAGNWAGPERIINFSYFAPYAYRYFARIDPEGQWDAALRTGYRVVEEITAGIAPLLPPDFAVLTAEGRVAGLPEGSRLSRDFSYDAIRILWRLELDCRVMQEPRGCAIVDRLLDRLERLRQRDGRFLSRYAISGQPLTVDESPSFAAAFLPAYTRRYPEVAAVLRRTTLSGDTLAAVRASKRRYYDANWIWFGLAASDGVIAARLPPLEAVARPVAAGPRVH